MDNPPPTRRQIALRRIQEKLHEMAAPAKDLSGSEELETILPVGERQAIWRELQAAGFELPELEISTEVFCLAAATVLTPLGLLVLALQSWIVLLSIVELAFLAYKLTPPAGYPSTTMVQNRGTSCPVLEEPPHIRRSERWLDARGGYRESPHDHCRICGSADSEGDRGCSSRRFTRMLGGSNGSVPIFSPSHSHQD